MQIFTRPRVRCFCTCAELLFRWSMKSIPRSHFLKGFTVSGDNVNILPKKSALFETDSREPKSMFPPEKAAEAIRAGRDCGPMRITGRLDLTHFQGRKLPPNLHC